MKLLILLTMILSLTPVFGASIKIENTFMVKAERYHQFRAYLYKDNGERLDVTNECNWNSFGNRERQKGEFLFELPRFGGTDRFSARIEVVYNGEEGMLTDTQSLWVDGTPDRIQIWGMSSTRSGGFITLRADAYYGGKRIDLTQRGQWSAMYGRVSSWGHYTAPYLRNRNSLYDSISFRFGSRTARHSISVRK